MELVRPILPFLAPAAYRLPQATTRAAASIAIHCKTPHSQRHQTARAFSTSQTSRKDEFPSITPRQTTVGDSMASLLDSSLDFGKGTPTAPSSRTSRFSSRREQATNPSSRSRVSQLDAVRPAARSSFDDIFSKMGGTDGPKQSRPSGGLSAQDLFGLELGGGRAPPEIAEGPPLKCGPRLGRTVRIDTHRGMDVGKAFRALETQCARNNVRKDFARQRYHERAGMKRKRLKSERWRKNFKREFKETVALVQMMRKQGW